jgi:hypothetical protein
MHQTFFASCLNLVDLFVCALCVLALAFHRALGDAWASVGAAALVIRYTAQFCRLAIVVFQCVHILISLLATFLFSTAIKFSTTTDI